VVNSLKSSVSWGSVSTRTFHDDWKQTSLRPQAESAKVASSSDENRTGDNSSNLATVINGPGTEDFHYTRSSASRAILSNNFLSEVPFLDKLEIVTRLSRSKGLAPVTNVVSPPLKDSAGQQQKTDQNVGQCIRRSVPSLRVCNLVNSPRSSSKQIESFQKEVQQKPAENNTGFKRKRTSDNLLKQPIAIDLKPGAVVLFAMFSLYFGIY